MKRIVLFGVVASFVSLTFLTSVVHAMLFNYSYTWNSGGVLAGTLEGTLQGGGNEVEVTSIMGSYTGPIEPDFDLLHSGAFAFPNGPGIVTLDGSNFNLFTGTSLFVNTELTMDTGSGGVRLWHPPGIGVTLVEDDGIGPLNSWDAADHWSIAPAPVPEPATMLLLGTGLAGLAGARFRRKKK